ncbi:hypothetical protein AC249_AIPGENE27875 [Exaiptasia diaphana]|nr:hypothetical protein AC249_AIPGENE27875 [Exaiptasia diaphana]
MFSGIASLLLLSVSICNLGNKINHSPQEWAKYGHSTLIMAIFSGFRMPFERSTMPDEFTDDNELPKDAWVKNGRSSVATEEFSPGNGFDLYIDGARFLPDSVTYTKVAGRVMDKNYEKN